MDAAENKAVVQFLEQAIVFSLSPAHQERGIMLIGQYFNHVFRVETDEMALFVIDPKGQKLYYAAPHALASIGASVNFNKTESVAGRALSEQKPQIVNGAAEKILSYPLFVDRSPLGAVQITRKKPMLPIIRPGFVPGDIDAVKAVDAALCRLLQSIRSAKFSKTSAT